MTSVAELSKLVEPIPNSDALSGPTNSGLPNIAYKHHILTISREGIVTAKHRRALTFNVRRGIRMLAYTCFVCARQFYGARVFSLQ